MNVKKNVIIVVGVLLTGILVGSFVLKEKDLKLSDLPKMKEQKELLNKDFEFAKEKKQIIDDKVDQICDNNRLLPTTTSSGALGIGVIVEQDDMDFMSKENKQLVSKINEMNDIDFDLMEKQNNSNELLQKYNETYRMLRYYLGVTSMFDDSVFLPSEISDSNDITDITNTYVNENAECSEEVMNNKEMLDIKYTMWEVKFND